MPFLLGLIIGLAALVYKFILKLADFIIAMPGDNSKLAWVVGILLAFAVAMLLLAIADRVGNSKESSE